MTPIEMKAEVEKLPKLPGPHDDLCNWWDNVGNEPLDYECDCGVVKGAYPGLCARLSLFRRAVKEYLQALDAVQEYICRNVVNGEVREPTRKWKKLDAVRFDAIAALRLLNELKE